jgi:hypothetical protein
MIQAKPLSLLENNHVENIFNIEQQSGNILKIFALTIQNENLGSWWNLYGRLGWEISLPM